ncbi:unnamed protein product [Alternaria alternata]
MSLSGKGVTVAVVDGGKDYLHPALGAGFGQGSKVQYGYDFVGDNVKQPNVEAPDDDPYGDCSNHATHTAGILFGDDVSIGFRGVAPGVSVEHYRVFDCNGVSTSDVVLRAVLKAVERKVDLINLSLEFIELVALSENQDVSEDGCQEIIPNPTLYQDKIVLIRRGGCSFKKKMHNLARAGGQYVLIYDNQPGPVFDLETRLDGITGGGSVSSETAGMLLSLLEEEREVRLWLDGNLILPPVITWEKDQQTAGTVSTFSSWGPSGESYTVTLLLGPGGRVLSTTPRKFGSWGLQSGTSMAVPYVVGCIARLKEAFPDVDSRTIADTLLHTAKPVAFNDGTDNTYPFLASVWQEGSGRVQAYDAFMALQSRVHISETSLHFNDTEFSHKTLSFKITNDGQEAFGYSISSRAAVTVLSFSSTKH